MAERIMVSEGVFLEKEGDMNALHIADHVEVFNIPSVEFEEYHVNRVCIGKGLQKIEGWVPFGAHVIDILVDEENQYFASISGVLFSKDGKKLVLYPAGREGSYEVPVGTEEIEDFAFYMESFPEKIVIPNTVKEVSSKAFIEMVDKGFGFTKEDIRCMATIYCPEELKEHISVIWNEKTYQKPAVVYYGENCKVSYEGKEYQDIKELCETYGQQVGKVCFYMEQYQLAVDKALEYCIEESKKFIFKVEDGCYSFSGISHISDLLGESVKDIRNRVIEDGISIARFLECFMDDADKDEFKQDICRIGRKVETTEPGEGIIFEVK